MIFDKSTSAEPVTDVNFDNHRNLYRERRDRFRNNPVAMRELAEWKAQNNSYEYTIITGLVPKAFIGKSFGSRPAAKTDTWFSEFELHNDKSLILSESEDSYVIGNKESYDRRQYPEWFSAKFKPGSVTPEGQAFGHTLVISRKRVFNVVDPDATAHQAALLKEMKGHFVKFWNSNGRERLVDRVRRVFDDQNDKLTSKEETKAECRGLLPQLEAGFVKLSKRFQELDAEDFVFAFHAYPDNSVGHLHMHVFPKDLSLREFSSFHHDWKTISLKAILDVEENANGCLENGS